MIHEFLDFKLDVERMELWCGAEKRAAEPQVFSLLVYLIENRDRVVSKDELFDAVWEGRIVSDATLNTRINAARKALGDSGKEQAVIRTIPRRGFRFVAEMADSGAPSAGAREQSLKQTVRFCTTADGVQIAYAISGEGPPLVKAPNWMHHLEYDWDSPVWGHLLRDLSGTHTLLRFDQRCNGLSDWDVSEVTFETMVDDLAVVVDAAGFTRFPLFGVSAGCCYSIAYAVRHPERVSRLVLYGGRAQGRMRTGSDADKRLHEARREMMLQGWGQNNPAFRQFFTSLFIPDATKEQMDWFNELQRTTVSPENAVRLNEVSGHADVSTLLGQISVPTLVLHCREDGTVPFEKGRRMASMIPNARFVALDSKNHLILEDEPAWPRFLAEVKDFLAEDDTAVRYP
jgi:pimeloyl-ACP methyl ester carboxylesterase/DNA-binding winged helix-turn-helix (wHTH) protein